MKSIKEISKDTDIIIYGAAGNGMRGYHSLAGLNGYNVVGFIDKRADEIQTQYGLPVWSLDGDIPFDKKECVVCVCIKNVFEHVSIVNNLIQKGFRYFIFKSLDMENAELEAINRNYDKVFCDAQPDLIYELENIFELGKLKKNTYRDCAILQERENEVVAAMPFELIYTVTADWPAAMKDNEGVSNSLALVPQISLFKLLDGSGDTEGMSIYLNHCASTIKNSEKKYGEGIGTIKDTLGWRKSIIENRTDVYNKMNESLELKYPFFVENAPLCVLGSHNRLLIKSAKHRLAFFIAKKRKYMPVKLSVEAYKVILNESCAKKIQKYIDADFMGDKVKVPIQHPMFYEVQAEWPNFYEQFIYPAALEIAIIFQNVHVLDSFTVYDALDDNGAAARYMNKIGFKAMCTPDQTDVHLSGLLDELMYASVNYSCGIHEVKDIDILFVHEKNWDASFHSKTKKVIFYVYHEECPDIEGFVRKKILAENIVGGMVLKMALYVREELERA